MDSQGEVFAGYIIRSVDRVLEAARDLSPDQLAWRPGAPGTNSIGVIATHVFGNLSDNVLGVLGGETVTRARAAEFAARDVSAEALALTWADLRPLVEAVLVAMDDAALSASYLHPRRGELRGFEVLLIVARHVAEHAGEAELTRSLCLARIPPHL